MASLGMRVICEILRSRAMRPAWKAGLNESVFKDYTEREIYKYIENYWRSHSTYKQFPSVEMIQRRAPSFEMVHIEEDAGNIETLVEDLREMVIDSEMVVIAKNFAELVQGASGDEAYGYILKSINELSSRYGKGAGQGFGLEEIIEGVRTSYEDALTGASYGIPWLWDPLTEDTLGKRPGDFIVFYGRMKSMKTWLLLANAVHDYMTYNQRVLFWSREMSEEQLKLRMGSIFAGVDYQLLKKGQLPGNLFPQAMERLEELRRRFLEARIERDRRIRTGEADIVVMSGKSAPAFLSRGEKKSQEASVEDAIEEWQPDIVYLDSFYHLRDGRADAQKQVWARIQYLAEGIKDLAIAQKIPIVAAAQANRLGEKLAGENLTEVAGSDAIAREADLIIRVLRKVVPLLNEEEYEGVRRQEIEEYDQTQEKVRRMITVRAFQPSRVPKKARAPRPEELQRKGAEILLRLGGNREGTLEGFTLDLVPGYRFNVLNPNVSKKEIDEWMKKDIDAADREIQEKLRKEEEARQAKRVAVDLEKVEEEKKRRLRKEPEPPVGKFDSMANGWREDRKIP